MPFEKTPALLGSMDYEKVLADLCSVYSQTGHGGTKEILKICQENITSPIAITERPSASIGCGEDLIFTRSGSGDLSLLLLGHYDTVPGRIENTELQKEGDKIFALGSFDMKGGIVLALEAIDYLKETQFKKIDLLLTGDEEKRSSPFQSPGNYDAVLAFEGGSLEGIVISRFGADILHFNLEGDSLRAEYPLPSPGGIDVVFDLHNDLKLLNNPDVHFTTSRIGAESAINVVPDKCSLAGVLRYSNEKSRKEYLDKIPFKHHGFRVQTIVEEVFPALFASRESREFSEKLGVFGTTRTGSSDISYLQSSSRLLFDGLGPFGGGDHTPEEHVFLSSFEKQSLLISTILDTLVLS